MIYSEYFGMMYDFQRVLLLLYTNEDFFSRFTKDTDAALSEFDLTAREQKALHHLPLAQITTFRKSLHRKRIDVSRKIIARSNTISLISFWKDSPAIMWGAAHAPRTESISTGMARILRELFRSKDVVSLGAIFRARNSLAEKVPLVDVVRLVQLVFAHRLFGKDVFAG